MISRKDTGQTGVKVGREEGHECWRQPTNVRVGGRDGERKRSYLEITGEKMPVVHGGTGLAGLKEDKIW